MKNIHAVSILATLTVLAVNSSRAGETVTGRGLADSGWTHDFTSEQTALTATGRNPYFVLEPGYMMVLKDGDNTLTITVKDKTRKIDNVQTRLIKEKEEKGGKPIEVSDNYFAISSRSNSVYYFGEDSGGAWFAGKDGARFGLIMPGIPLVGARYYQEIAPGVDMDRAQIISTDATVKTPAGVFRNCLKIEETNQLEPGEVEYKYFAPGIGLVQDESLKLVRYGMTSD